MTDGAESAEEGERSSGTDEDFIDALDEELIAQIAAEDESLAGAVGELQKLVVDLEDRLADREDRIEELEDQLKRTKADFQNYKRRREDREKELKERVAGAILENMLEVRDNLDRALEQEDGDDIRDGLEVTVNAFDRLLDNEGVEEIDPETGSDVDPRRHQVVHREPSSEAEGRIVDVYRVGYELEDTVLREAQVTVSEGPADAPEQDEASGEAD